MKYLEEYKQRIRNGDDIINTWMKLNISYIENGLKEGRFFYDERKANIIITFIENFCHHIEGSTDLVELEPWQKYFLACVFGIVDKNGNRQFREVVLVEGRKQGKSLIAGGVEIAFAFTEDEAGMQIYNIAPKLEQAGIIFNVVYKMITLVSSLSKRVKKRRSDLYIKYKDCTMKPIAFSSKKSDGFNPALVIFDEFGAWEGEAGLRMYNVMLSAGGARKQPLYLSVSTANYIDDGLYDELLMRSEAVLKGTSEEKRLLPFIYCIDDESKWDNINELRKAMPNLGVSVSYDFIEEEIRKAKASRDYKAEFLTKYCNIKQNSVTAWLSAHDIKQTMCERLELEKFARCYGVGGIDLSKTTDLTCASIVIRLNKIDYIFSQFFMPAQKIDELSEREHIRYRKFVDLGFLTVSGEHHVDYHDVCNWFEEMKKKYRIYVCVVGYDIYSAQYLIDEMTSKGYRMDSVRQGTNLTPVIDEFGGLVRDGTIRTGTNGLLQSHMASVALKRTAEDNRVQAVKVDSRKHIDGFVSVIDAYTVRQKWYKEFQYRIENKKG